MDEEEDDLYGSVQPQDETVENGTSNSAPHNGGDIHMKQEHSDDAEEEEDEDDDSGSVRHIGAT